MLLNEYVLNSGCYSQELLVARTVITLFFMVQASAILRVNIFL